MKTGIILFILLLIDCDKNMVDGFHYLKEWSINSPTMEVSYVLTSGTSYRFKFCSQSKGEFVLEDNERRTILKMTLDKTSDVVWKSQSTGIRYMRFVGMESNALVLGFKR